MDLFYGFVDEVHVYLGEVSLRIVYPNESMLTQCLAPVAGLVHDKSSVVCHLSNDIRKLVNPHVGRLLIAS